MSRPLKIMIVGNSVPLLVLDRPSREDGTYGEQLERVLDEQGCDARVLNHARLFELIHEGGRRFRHELAGVFPDVVIFHYGILEMQPNVAPTTVVRHLTRIERSGKGPRALWMRRGVPAVWPHVRRYQKWAAAKTGLRTWRLSPLRFAAELDHDIDVARRGRALVLVADIGRPNQRLEYFLPGMGERWEVMQDTLRRVVDGRDDPDVRLIEVSKVLEELEGSLGTPDGLHLTAAAHGRVAEMIAREILDWAGGGG